MTVLNKKFRYMSSELVSKNYDYEVSHWKGNNRVFDMFYLRNEESFFENRK